MVSIFMRVVCGCVEGMSRLSHLYRKEAPIKYYYEN